MFSHPFISKAKALALSAALVGGTILVAQAPTASAIGGNCSAIRQHQVRNNLPDLYRVRASCSSLQGDSKARGVLDRNLVPTALYTSWFTSLNKYYYSGWGDSIYGSSARTEIKGV